ncbi:hypothetical protein Droror1_Dr00014163 [Drosera rotundifolia]
MAFSSNPLSLSINDQAFESWLRDNNYLELLDHRTTQLHHSSTTTTPPTTNSTTTTTLKGIFYAFTMSMISSIITLLSLFTINPFAKLESGDFGGKTPSWTKGFVGSMGCYSFPANPENGRLRVHENVKRFARNYAMLFVLCFACTLYQMPLALLGLLSCLALWDMFRFCNERWLFERYPVMQEVLTRILQCVAAIILLFSNVQMALFFTVIISYAAMILHAAFHKLTPAMVPPKGRSR